MIIESISNRLCNHFVENRIIEEEDREIYQYGLHQGIVMIINFISMLVIGILLHMVLQSILFLIFFIPIRTYAGGYHAKTQTRCYFVSLGIDIIALLGIRYLPTDLWISTIILIITSAVFLKLAPSEAENKPLSEGEVTKYKRVARIIWVIETIMLFFAVIFKFQQLGNCILISFAVLSILLIMGEFKKLRNIS